VNLVSLHELEERVQHPANLANVVVGRASGADGIELIEQVNAASRTHRIEYKVELGGGLTHVLCDQAMQLHKHERQIAFAG
jgi:hypothetical protein